MATRGRFRWLRRGIIGTVGLAILVLGGPWALAEGLSLGKVGPAAQAPARDVAIVFGAAVLPDGTPSNYLRGRLDVAADLYERGAVRAILVSGDNSTQYYNEPDNMKRYLVDSRGIPTEKVVTDYAGFDTYDTCVRARRIFGITSATLVTQDYHLTRAVATCRMTGGMNVVGAPDTSRAHDRTWWYGWSREFGARLKMLYDVVTRRTPTLGAQETGIRDALGKR
ncbi:Integral membrane protein [Acidipropionibacterium acidipropionici ATCC 4875]|uniref:Integral membrane protein n=1 Tax=Acidipropionibacterium acidipropionici (strain ATCC 4875 / DSM 20272 / JCM 6432 / NBRC 12425 / NCIMB 8070 / 4) TaxID=1171373 RepID=K7S1Q0_ACIA4|nr:ElyC/SanA/YdcF family protein [Acidipropionibacterium acidipropionici]AFV88482.1 Integral membrane protein [Acidipropionibacterium acidipropionici ATCC 4875]